MTPRLNNPAISLENVAYFFLKRKSYLFKKKFWALKDVSFTLYRGESLGVIGRNGAGKSTLLRLLAGITAPDKGRVTNFGCSVSLLSLQAGFIGYLSGRENAVLNGLILGLKKQEILERMEEIKAFSGLGDFFEQPISAYSSGMKARLGFSIAFQMDPDIFLIDEVMGVGDGAFREKSTRIMKEKILSEKTVVLVSHSPSTIEGLCDRVVWLDKGKTRLEGDKQEVLDAYAEFLTTQS